MGIALWIGAMDWGGGFLSCDPVSRGTTLLLSGSRDTGDDNESMKLASDL